MFKFFKKYRSYISLLLIFVCIGLLATPVGAQSPQESSVVLEMIPESRDSDYEGTSIPDENPKINYPSEIKKPSESSKVNIVQTEGITQKGSLPVTGSNDLVIYILLGISMILILLYFALGLGVRGMQKKGGRNEKICQ